MPAAENGELTLKVISAAEYVGKHTPPAFVVHTYEDTMVSMEQSLQIVTALSKADVPVEYHVFTPGAHAAPNQLISKPTKYGRVPGFYDWFDRCCEWLKDWFGYPRMPEFSIADIVPADGKPLPFMTRTHEDTLACMVTSDMMSFFQPQSSSEITISTKLRDIVECPGALEVIYQYVPQLRDFKLNDLTLNLSLANLLAWSGYKSGNPFMHTIGDPEIEQCIAALRKCMCAN